jgi:hypothetical protein
VLDVVSFGTFSWLSDSFDWSSRKLFTVSGNEQKSIDLGRLEWNAIENLHRDEEVHTTDNVDDTSCEIAKQLELQKLCHFDTYEEVEDCGQKTIFRVNTAGSSFNFLNPKLKSSSRTLI